MKPVNEQMRKRIANAAVDAISATQGLQDKSEQLIALIQAVAVLGAQLTNNQPLLSEMVMAAVNSYPSFYPEREQELRNENLTH